MTKMKFTQTAMPATMKIISECLCFQSLELYFGSGADAKKPDANSAAHDGDDDEGAGTPFGIPSSVLISVQVATPKKRKTSPSEPRT